MSDPFSAGLKDRFHAGIADSSLSTFHVLHGMPVSYHCGEASTSFQVTKLLLKFLKCSSTKTENPG
jgi:hypothetical protein